MHLSLLKETRFQVFWKHGMNWVLFYPQILDRKRFLTQCQVRQARNIGIKELEINDKSPVMINNEAHSLYGGINLMKIMNGYQMVAECTLDSRIISDFSEIPNKLELFMFWIHWYKKILPSIEFLFYGRNFDCCIFIKRMLENQGSKRMEKSKFWSMCSEIQNKIEQNLDSKSNEQ